MNKKFLYVAIAFVLCGGTASADFWYVNSTYTTVQSVQPKYSLSTETFWDQVPSNQLPPVQSTECSNGSCSTVQYTLGDSTSNNYTWGGSCDTAAAHFGIAAQTYTCSQNYNQYSWSTGAGGGGGDGGLGVGIPGFGWYRTRSTIELYLGNVGASAPCKPEPSSWSSITQNGYGTPAHISECTTSVHQGTAAPIATLTAAPSTITAPASSALTYSCSNGATSASIDNGVGAVTPAAAGTVPVSPTATTAYTVTCTNANGTGTDSATVTVSPQQPDLTPLSLTPHTVVAGTQSTFTATLHNGGTAPTPTFSSTVYV
ncbi:MAG: Odd Oz/ten-m 4, partial [Parcubacteria group bacterium]|nr:Odd Oz/ten-m 4 [Parcubacteria group bacterium]